MPKVVDKELKKLEIMSAAIKVFAKKGFANTKMADVADAAKIGKGTIYEYFKNKNEIFAETFHHFMDQMETEVAKKVFKLTDPVEKLRVFFLTWADIMLHHSADVMEIMLDVWAEAVRQKDETQLKVIDLEKMYSEFRIYIKSILDEGIREGKFKPVNTFITASLLFGTLDGIMLQWILNRNVFDIREAVECLLDEFLNGIYVK